MVLKNFFFINFVTTIALLGLTKICLSISASNSFLPKCPPTEYYHNCYEAVVYEDGDAYFGEWLNNKWHGEGTFLSKTGKYVGGWRNGTKYATNMRIISDFLLDVDALDSAIRYMHRLTM